MRRELWRAVRIGLVGAGMFAVPLAGWVWLCLTAAYRARGR